MIAYLIKSILCLTTLWAFYALFLEKERIHHFNRGYLLFSLLFAFTIPLITFTYQTEMVAVPLQVSTSVVPTTSEIPVPTPTLLQKYGYNILWSLYAIGTMLFAFRFFRNLAQLIQKIRKNEKHNTAPATLVLLNQTVVPHTFLKYIFVSKTAFHQERIPEEVLQHEKTHARQQHTIDLLFVELLQLLFWFNPLLYLFKKSIKLNHEFLADEAVIKQQFSISHYIDLLIHYPNGTNHTVLSSPINYSLTKKRLQMMTTDFSKTRVTMRLLLFTPVLIGCLFLFNNKIVAQQKQQENKGYVAPTGQSKKIAIQINGEQISINGRSTDLAGFPQSMDEATKQWKDSELAGFQLDIHIQRDRDDDFIEKLNAAYKKTRLYNANQNAHVLIPPVPVPPHSTDRYSHNFPEESEISRLPEHNAVPNLPSPPSPPSPPVPPSPNQPEVSDNIEEHIYSQETQNNIEEEITVADAIAMEEGHMARVQARKHHEQTREQARHTSENTRKNARETMIVARTQALEQARAAREEAREYANIAREQARYAREEAMAARDLNRKAFEEAYETAREAAQKDAEKRRRKAVKKALKHIRKSNIEIKSEHEAERARMEEEIERIEEAKMRKMEIELERKMKKHEDKIEKEMEMEMKELEIDLENQENDIEEEDVED